VVPNQPKTPQRNIRVTDDLWFQAMAKAIRVGKHLSDIIRRDLERWVNDDNDTGAHP